MHTILVRCRSCSADIHRSQIDCILYLEAHDMIFSFADVFIDIVCAVCLLLRCTGSPCHLDHILHLVRLQRGSAKDTSDLLAVLERDGNIFALWKISQMLSRWRWWNLGQYVRQIETEGIRCGRVRAYQREGRRSSLTTGVVIAKAALGEAFQCHLEGCWMPVG